jgi:hypothetical protein
VIGAAVKVTRIATGEESEEITIKSVAAELGSRGGKARAQKLNAEQRTSIARKAARKRWGSR